MYYIVLILLVIYSFVELYTKKQNHNIFCAIYFFITLMATFRYGQLGDYFAYRYLFNHPEVIGIKDPLFAIIINIYKWLNFDYIVFSSTLSLLSMIIAYPFFKKTCNESLVALFIFYSYTFLWCTMSAMRQSLCLSLLLYLYTALVEKKYVTYYIGIFIGCFIHMSIIIAIIFPFIVNNKYVNSKYIIYLILICFLFSFLNIDYTKYLPLFLEERVTGYLMSKENSNIIFQLLLRLLLIIPILYFKPNIDTHEYRAKAICIVGFCLYCILSADTLVSGRLEYYFRTFLCLFIAMIICKKNRGMKYRIVPTMFILIHIFLWFKNIDFARKNGEYRSDITMFNLPYISIFEKEDLIKYTPIEYYTPE